MAKAWLCSQDGPVMVPWMKWVICERGTGSVALTERWLRLTPIPKCSMYGILTYIWAIFRANVGKYSIMGIWDWLMISSGVILFASVY